MSAILVLRQHDSVHMMTDGAAYEQPSGIMHSVDLKKCFAMPEISAAVSCTGPATLSGYWGYRLPEVFDSFDDLVATGNDRLPSLFEEYADAMREGDAFSTFYVIGWHAGAARPAAYCMDMWTDSSSRIDQVLANGHAAGTTVPQRFKLAEQLAAGTPIPAADRMTAAGLKIADDVNRMDPEIDLLHLMEVQRHEKIEGHHWVGGNAMLTSIDRHGVSQRIVHTWSEDEVGKVIEPPPIDYKAWRTARTMARIRIPDGLSRLQRERMEKKARKGTLRVAR